MGPRQALRDASATALSEADAPRRPVNREHRPHQVLAWNGAPATGVARGRAVVAEHDVGALGHRLLGDRAPVPSRVLDVRLVQLLVVDVDVTVLLAPALPRQSDQ